MLSYKLYLESLNTPYEYKYDRFHDMYNFTTDAGIEYEVQFNNDTKQVGNFLDRFKNDYEVSFATEDGDMSKTNTGDQFKVFATVIKITQDFIRSTKVNRLLVSSEKEDQSRTKLYNKLIKKFSNWKLTREEKSIFDVFILTNPNYKD